MRHDKRQLQTLTEPMYYILLALTEEQDIIRLTAADGRRKSYIITDTGREELRKEYSRLLTLVSDGKFYFG